MYPSEEDYDFILEEMEKELGICLLSIVGVELNKNGYSRSLPRLKIVSKRVRRLFLIVFW